jgi:hypothetical protein
VLGTGGSVLVVSAYTVNDGNAGGNYSVSLSTASGTITPKNLTVTGVTAANKPWDGNTAATLNTAAAALNGAVIGDAVGLDKSAAVGTFANSGVGTWTVQISGLALTVSTKATTHSDPAFDYGEHRRLVCDRVLRSGRRGELGLPATTLSSAPTVGSTGVWNTAKGGSTVPLKFNLYNSNGGAERTSTVDVKVFDQTKLSSCGGSAGEDPVDLTITGGTSLRYDLTGKQFIQNWKTPAVGTDTCYRVSVQFMDGSSIYTFFKLKK